MISIGASFPQRPPSFPSADAAAVPRRRKAARLPINAAEFDVHETHRPIAAWRFREPHDFPADRFADKDPLAVPLNLPGLLDAAHLVRGVIPRLLEPRVLRVDAPW